MKINTLLFIVLAMLAGCSNQSEQIIVAPQLVATNQLSYQQMPAQLTVQDMRTKQHLVQILATDKAAILHSSANNITQVIEKNLAKQWQQQGLKITANAATQITVFIDAALVSVNQQTLKYTANNELRIRVQIAKNNQTQTTHFKTTGSSNGPLRPDIAVLERDFNQQLGTILTNILTNADVQNFLRN